MGNLRDFKTSFPSQVWWLCVVDQPWLHEQIPAQATLHALSMSLGTEDCRVQMKGDPKASPGHEERPMNLFRQTSLSAVHSNQNTR